MGGWSPNLDFFFFLKIVCFVFFCCCMCFQKFFYRGWVFGVWPISVFVDFLDFLNLTRHLTTLKYFYISPGDCRIFFQFEIIINVLVSSFHFIWIPMLWVYGHYNGCYCLSAAIDFRRQNLTFKVVRFWRLNPLTSRPGCIPGSRYTGVGVLFFVIWSWNC